MGNWVWAQVSISSQQLPGSIFSVAVAVVPEATETPLSSTNG